MKILNEIRIRLDNKKNVARHAALRRHAPDQRRRVIPLELAEEKADYAFGRTIARRGSNFNAVSAFWFCFMGRPATFARSARMSGMKLFDCDRMNNRRAENCSGKKQEHGKRYGSGPQNISHNRLSTVMISPP